VTINTNGFSGALTGGLSGSGTITKNGSGALTLGGVNTSYSGAINLNAGVLVLATSAASSSTGLITAANGTTLQVTASGASIPLHLANGANVTLSAGGLTYNGAVTGPAGSTLVISNGSTGASNFSVNGSLADFNGVFSLGSSSGNVRIGSSGSPSAHFNLGTSTGTIRTTSDGTVHLGALTGGPSTRLQGSTNGTGSNTHVIGALNTTTTFAGTITDGTNSTPGIVNITKVGTGELTLTNAASSYTGATTVNGGRLLFAAKIPGGAVLVTAGRLTVAAKGAANDPSGTSIIRSLSIGAGVLDLTNNSMVIDYATAAGSLLEETRQLLASGKLISSAATPARGLGYADNAALGLVKPSFSGIDVDSSSLLIGYTYFGDADLDGDVDVADLGALASAWQSAGLWSGGDFDYNGTVDVNDLGMLASNWQAGVGSPSAPFDKALDAFGTPLTPIPEPSLGGLFSTLGVLAARRRNRQKQEAARPHERPPLS
jgi:autotransporter-associated beta strand protein